MEYWNGILEWNTGMEYWNDLNMCAVVKPGKQDSTTDAFLKMRSFSKSHPIKPSKRIIQNTASHIKRQKVM